MDGSEKPPATIDEYIAAAPKEVQSLLQAMRQTIHNAAPQAEEAMRYAMPTFRLKEDLVHFAAHKHHIGFYPTPSGIQAFKKQLSAYKSAIGVVQFPLDQPIPFDLVAEIVKYRVAQVSKH